MDIQKTIALFNRVLKEYEKSEVFSIFMYSTDFERDFKIMQEKSKGYKRQLDKIIADAVNTKQVRDITREENLQT